MWLSSPSHSPAQRRELLSFPLLELLLIVRYISSRWGMRGKYSRSTTAGSSLIHSNCEQTRKTVLVINLPKEKRKPHSE